jgi:hypothetical protein
MIDEPSRRRFVLAAATSAGAAAICPRLLHAAPDTDTLGLVERIERLDGDWPAPAPYPPPGDIAFPDAIEHGRVDTVDDAYRFLHDPAVAVHEDVMFAAWYNCPQKEIVGESLIRCRRSADGGRTWSDREVVAADRDRRGIHYVPVQLLSHSGGLYAFVGKMEGGHDQIKTCALYRRDAPVKADTTGDTWRPIGNVADRFLPNFAPVRMDDGNYVMAGRTSVAWPAKPMIPAIAISRGDAINEPWTVIRLTPGGKPFPDGQCPETTLIVDGSDLVAITRNNNHKIFIPFVSTSRDFGRTWSRMSRHNLRALNSKLYSGTLSTGQHYVIFNHPQARAYRGMLVIAVSRPHEAALSRIWKVQESGAFARASRRPIMAHYPCAIEFEGNFHIVYNARFGLHKACEMAVIPVASLA